MRIIKLKNDTRQVIRTTTTEKTGQEEGGENNNDEFNKLSFWDLNVIKHHSVVELICSRYLVYYLVPLSSCSSTAPWPSGITGAVCGSTWRSSHEHQIFTSETSCHPVRRHVVVQGAERGGGGGGAAGDNACWVPPAPRQTGTRPRGRPRSAWRTTCPIWTWDSWFWIHREKSQCSRSRSPSV